MQGDPHGPPISRFSVSVNSEGTMMEHPVIHSRDRVLEPSPHSVFQDDQSVQAANVIISTVAM